MTRLPISCLFAGLLAFSGAAWAQGNDDNKDRGNKDRGHEQAAPAQAAQPAPRIGGRYGHGFNPGPAQNAPAARNASAAPAPRDAMRDQGPGNTMRGPTGTMRGPNTAMRAPGRDFSSFHRNFTAPQRFHAAAYRRPGGWYPRHWVYGEILPSLFWTENYWLTDYAYFDLDPPPPGTVWVRDGADALLIDRFDGEIIEVAYGVFY